MAWTILAAAGVAAAAAVVGGIINKNAAGSAAEKQKAAADEAMRGQREMYAQQRADMMPWLQTGRASLADLNRQMQAGSFNTQLDPSQIANDPGYQFRLAEGQKALERGASARGLLSSGGAMKGLQRFGQGLASDEYQNAYARTQSENMNRYNRLANLAGVGQAAAQNMGAMGAQNAANMGNLYGNIGNAQAAGIIGQGNAMAGMAQGIGNAASMAMGGMSGGGGFGSMLSGQRIPTQGAGYGGGYQGGMVPGRSANFGLNYGSY